MIITGTEDPIDACVRQAWCSGGLEKADDLLIPSGLQRYCSREYSSIFPSVLPFSRSVEVRDVGEADVLILNQLVDLCHCPLLLYGQRNRGSKPSSWF
jgi:hypothetical protein